MTSVPHYPDISVHVRSRNPLTLVAAVRQALRQAKVERSEIQRFSSEAFSSEDPRARRRVCGEWVQVR